MVTEGDDGGLFGIILKNGINSSSVSTTNVQPRHNHGTTTVRPVLLWTSFFSQTEELPNYRNAESYKDQTIFSDSSYRHLTILSLISLNCLFRTLVKLTKAMINIIHIQFKSLFNPRKQNSVGAL